MSWRAEKKMKLILFEDPITDSHHLAPKQKTQKLANPWGIAPSGATTANQRKLMRLARMIEKKEKRQTDVPEKKLQSELQDRVSLYIPNNDERTRTEQVAKEQFRRKLNPPFKRTKKPAHHLKNHPAVSNPLESKFDSLMEEVSLQFYEEGTFSLTAEQKNTLLDYFAYPNLSQFLKLCRNPPKQPLVFALLEQLDSEDVLSYVLQKMGKEESMAFTKAAIAHQIVMEKAGTLFQAPSAAVKLMTEFYMQRLLPRFKKEFEKMVSDLPEGKIRLSSDKDHFGQDELMDQVIETDVKKVEGSFNAIMQRLLKMGESKKFPVEIIELNRFVSDCIKERFEDPELAQEFKGQILLRFLIPILMAPENKLQRYKRPKKLENGGLFISQLLQQLINNKSYEPHEKEMVRFNDFLFNANTSCKKEPLKTHRARMKDFLERIH